MISEISVDSAVELLMLSPDPFFLGANSQKEYFLGWKNLSFVGGWFWREMALGVHRLLDRFLVWLELVILSIV